MALTCVKAAKILEDQLSQTAYLTGSTATLADYAVFADIGQCSKEDLDIFDFTPFPFLSAWVTRMKSLPAYAETHEAMPMIRIKIDEGKALLAKGKDSKL